jgi:hypothetical protein
MRVYHDGKASFLVLLESADVSYFAVLDSSGRFLRDFQTKRQGQ